MKGSTAFYSRSSRSCENFILFSAQICKLIKKGFFAYNCRTRKYCQGGCSMKRFSANWIIKCPQFFWWKLSALYQRWQKLPEYFHCEALCRAVLRKFPGKRKWKSLTCEIFRKFAEKLIKLPATTWPPNNKSHYDLSTPRSGFYWRSIYEWQLRERISECNRTTLASDTKWTGHYFWQKKYTKRENENRERIL